MFLFLSCCRGEMLLHLVSVAEADKAPCPSPHKYGAFYFDLVSTTAFTKSYEYFARDMLFSTIKCFFGWRHVDVNVAISMQAAVVVNSVVHHDSTAAR